MPKKRFVKGSVMVASSSALALILSTAPVVIDLSGSGLGLSHVYAASSCFVAGTLIRMEDRSLVPIERIRVGDRVLGAHGEINVVLGIERRRLGLRRLYGFNGSDAFFTAEHPFMTDDGQWKALNPSMTADENPLLEVSRLKVGDSVLVWSRQNRSGLRSGGNLALALDLEPLLDSVLLQTVENIEAPAETCVFNLILNGNNTYFADDYLVHNKGGGGGGGGGEGGEGGEGGGSGGSGSEGGGKGSGKSGKGSGKDGESAEAGEAAEGDEGGERGTGRGRGRGRGMSGGSENASSRFGGDVSPDGPSLSAEQEADAISRGWNN